VQHFGIKEHTAVDAKHGFILATIHSPASVHDTDFLQYSTIFNCHTNKPIKTVYADTGYAGLPNRNFLSDNKIAAGFIRKVSTTAKLSELEIKRNKEISKVRYIVNIILGSVIFMTKPSGHDVQRI
jgi:transposase, IS5 family